MIRTEDAIRTARSLLGTPYEKLDCINLIKRVIRTAKGGRRHYTTAGTASLWASAESCAKYRDLTARYSDLSGAAPGMLAFKGRPLGRDGEPSHVGLVTERGTVIHSSSVYGCVVETPLSEREGWRLLAVHRDIRVGKRP